jgi:hypothetical protein
MRFKMVNEQGGVTGRKINFISLDDGYSPPKTLEQVRRLIEEDKVAFLFNTLGTATNSAIQRYVNERKVPNLFTEHALEVSYCFEVLRDAYFEKALIDHLSSSARRPIIPAIFAG